MSTRRPKSKVDAARARLFKLTFANPVSGLTPTRLVTYLNAFTRGELKQAALLWQQILERDDQAGPCANKRARGVSRLQWQILPIDDSPEAAKHKTALEHFYNNLKAYDGLNEMERGGVRKLIKQMMSAEGMRYAMHEIIWKPGAPGGLTAEFKFLPLQFFENTTGRLRYLRTDHELYGVELDEFFGPGNWMCTAGAGLMVATSLAYLFKTPTGIKAWVNRLEKFGIPGIHASTSAQKGTPEWDALVEAVTCWGEDLGLVTGDGAKILPIDVSTAGEAPHASFVDRMDRAISRIWMGGDLATMAKDGGAVGSQPQDDDLDTLKEDDAENMSDALNEYVDTQVIRQLFGDVAPLAYFSLIVPKKKTTDESVKRIETGVKYGVGIAESFVRQELDLPEPKASDTLIEAPAPPPAAPGAPGAAPRAVNEGRFVARLVRAINSAELLQAKAKAFGPILAEFREIEALPAGEAQDAALARLHTDLPRLYTESGLSGDEVTAWENLLRTAMAKGLVDAPATSAA